MRRLRTHCAAVFPAIAGPIKVCLAAGPPHPSGAAAIATITAGAPLAQPAHFTVRDEYKGSQEV